MVESASESSNSLSTLTHDLRNSFSAINFVNYYLDLHELTTEERELYLDVLSRNLVLADLLLKKISTMSGHREARVGLVRQLQAQLPNVNPKEYHVQMALLSQHLTALLDGI